MTDNTHPLQVVAARAIDRATGRRMRFIPVGDESLAFNVVGTFTPNPVTRFPDGSQIIGEEPVMHVFGRQLAGLLDDDGEPRDPEGGNVAPDYVNVKPGAEGNRKVLAAEMGHNGYWKLTLTNPV